MRQHRFKNFVALFLVFVLVIGLMPIEDATIEVKAASQTQQNENVVEVSTWAGLQAVLGRNGATIKLSNDIEAEPGDAGLVVTGSAITIDLNNHAINRNLTVATSAGFVFKVDTDSTVKINNGTITGGFNGENGGGILVEKGKLVLNSCVVENNHAENGGGLYFSAECHRPEINNCTIRNNTAQNGGGIYSEVGSSLNTCSIIENKSEGGKGSGMYIDCTRSGLTEMNLIGTINMESDPINPSANNSVFLYNVSTKVSQNDEDLFAFENSKIYFVGDPQEIKLVFGLSEVQAKCFKVRDLENQDYEYDFYRGKFLLPNGVTVTKSENLIYNSSNQQLIQSAVATAGAVYYQVDDRAYPSYSITDGPLLSGNTSGWTNNLSEVVGKDAGTYRVWYGVVGDGSHCNIKAQYVDVTIDKADSNIDTNVSAGTVRAMTDENIQVTLPVLPEGMSYKTPVVSGGVIALINTGVPMSITEDNANGHILTFAVTSKSHGTNATISVPVDGGKNYRDTCLTVDVTVNTRIDQKFSFEKPTIKKIYNDPSFIIEPKGQIFGQVTYSASGSAVTVDQTTGEVTINGCGTATICATAAGNDNYKPGTAYYTVIVEKLKLGPSSLIVTGEVNLQYDKNEHPLVTASGSAPGAVYYAVTDENVNTAPTSESEWGSEIPKRKDAGKYKVWYKVVPYDYDSANYAESNAYSVFATINKASLPAGVKTLVENRQLIAQKEAEYYVFLNELPGEDMSYAEPSVTADEKSLIKDGSLRLENVVADGKNRTKLYFTTNKTSMGAFAQISVKVKGGKNYSDGNASVKATVGLRNDLNPTFAQSSVEKNFGDSSFTNAISNGLGNVIYSSDNTSVAEVDSSGLVTIKGVGTATIKAKVNSLTNGNPDDTDYNVKTITYELTVSTGTPRITNAPGYTNLRFDPESDGSLEGNEQSLLSIGGSITGGIMYYSVTDASVATPPAIDFAHIDASVWSNQVPKRSDAGTYRVWYAVKGSTNYCNLEPTFDKHVDVTIAPADHPFKNQTSEEIRYAVNKEQGFYLLKGGLYANFDFKTCEVKSDPDGLVKSYRFEGEENDPTNHTKLLIVVNAKPYGTEATLTMTASAKNYNEFTFDVPLKVLNPKDRTYAFDKDIIEVVFEKGKRVCQPVKGDVSGTLYETVDDGSQAAKIDPNSGVIMLIKTGTITIKASAVESADHEFKAAEATYILKIVEGTPEITKTPEAKQDLVYIEGTAQQLVASGSAINGTMLYAVLDDADADAPDASAFSEDIPEKTDAGKYAVWYMVRGNAGYSSIIPDKVIVEIKPANQTITAEKSEITKTFGDDPFTNRISGAKTELTYAVKSGADVVEVGADGRITVKGSGEARIGVTAASTDKYNNAYVEFVVVVNKADSEIVKAPEAAKNLTYNGKDQTLVSEGTAKGGNMLYAVTKKADETVAEDAFASELPTGKEAGNYFVWYMVKGDRNHNDLFVKDVVRVVIDVPYVPEPVSGGGSGGSGSAESNTETETTETEPAETEKTEPEKESEQKEETTEPEVVTNDDGSTTTTTVEENEDGSVTTKEETISADGSAVTKEETVMADGSVVAKEEAVSSDGTVITKEEKTDAKGNKETKEETVEADGTTTKREETKNARGEGTATVVKADADGNVLSETQETTSVNKKGSVTVKSVTENADGSTVESSVKTTKSGNVTATVVEKDADGSVTTTNETVKNYASGAVKTKTEKVETDAEGNVVATVEKTVKVAKADEEGKVKTTSTVKSTDAEGNVRTTKETVVVDAKGQASVSSVTTSEDGTKEEKSFAVSSKGTVKMSALETTAKEVEIPKTVEVNGVECPVTTISKNAMKGNKTVTSVEIGENITTIGAGAFRNSKNLETIELTDSITKISANAFKGIAKNATFKIKASSQDEFDRIVALLKESGVSDTVKFEMA